MSDVENIFYDRSDLTFRTFRGRGSTTGERHGNVVACKDGPFMLIHDHIEVVREHKDQNGKLAGKIYRLEQQLAAVREGKQPDFYVIMNDNIPVDMFPVKDLAEKAMHVLDFKAGHSTRMHIVELWK